MSIYGTTFLRKRLLRLVTLLLPSTLMRYESKPRSSTIFPVLVHLPGCFGAAWSWIITMSPGTKGKRVLVPRVSCSCLRRWRRERACSRISAPSLHSWRTVKEPGCKGRWSFKTHCRSRHRDRKSCGNCSSLIIARFNKN